MTVKECYDLIGGDYDDVIDRLGMEKLVEKFMLKFREDKAMPQLRAAIAEDNTEQAFRAAHTLKGVAINLAFKNLEICASDLTEQLRPLENKPDSELVGKVENEYDRIVDILNQYEAQKA